MFHPEDYETSEHFITLNMVDDEEEYCQRKLMALYNEGLIDEDKLAERLRIVKHTRQKMQELVNDFENVLQTGAIYEAITKHQNR